MFRKLSCVCPRHETKFSKNSWYIDSFESVPCSSINKKLSANLKSSFCVCFSCFDPWYLFRPLLSRYWTVVLKPGNFCFILSLTFWVKRPNQNLLISGRVLHTQVLFGDGLLKKAIQNEARKTCTRQGSGPQYIYIFCVRTNTNACLNLGTNILQAGMLPQHRAARLLYTKITSQSNNQKTNKGCDATHGIAFSHTAKILTTKWPEKAPHSCGPRDCYPSCAKHPHPANEALFRATKDTDQMGPHSHAGVHVNQRWYIRKSFATETS